MSSPKNVKTFYKSALNHKKQLNTAYMPVHLLTQRVVTLLKKLDKDGPPFDYTAVAGSGKVGP